MHSVKMSYCVLLVPSLELGLEDIVYPSVQLEANQLNAFEELKWSIMPETKAAIQKAYENLVMCVCHYSGS